MIKQYTFDSKFKIGAGLPEFTQKQVKDEPMFFSCTPKFAFDNGGPITKAFLMTVFEDTALQLGPQRAIEELESNKYCFDSRVHMLMPGWWPCIPGWHHDDVARRGTDNQPDYDNPPFKSKHILGLINGDICPTEFATGKVNVYRDTDGTGVYDQWDKQINKKIDAGMLECTSVPSNRLIHFDCDSFHQGTQAVANGWRWFGRLTWDAGYTEGRPHANEIRRQVQVYMEMPKKGW